ncbi:MAG TPA: HupE/UreJ family protein, partial [Leucothrix sp.]|nr:HupE/UreJ family protein [Leucothrix sp.]
MPFLKVKHFFILLFSLLFGLLGIVSSFSLSAHEIRPSVVDITIDNKSADNAKYKMIIKLNLEALISNIGVEHQDTKDSDKAHVYDGLRQMPFNELIEEFEEFEPKLLHKIQLKFNGKPQTLNITGVDIPDVGDLDLARDSVIYFTGELPANTQNINWQWDESFGNAVLRVGTEQTPELYSSYLLDGTSSGDITLFMGTAETSSNQNNSSANTSSATPISNQASNKWEQFKNYLQVGFVHIVPKGLDHVLFVIGLFLLSTQLRPLLIQITSFTLAHSVTLALGIYGVVTVSPAIVEPLIAASIIYVAVENIYADKLSRWRPLIIFLFGLLHGLGFASVLKEIGLASDNFVTGLIAFNIGVELGQLAVIAACFLMVGFWFRHKPWYRQRIT